MNPLERDSEQPMQPRGHLQVPVRHVPQDVRHARYAVAARTIPAIVFPSDTRQCGGVHPIAFHVKPASRTLYCGRRAGKGYSEVLTGTIASVISSRPSSSARSWIATANSYRLAQPELAQ